MNIVTYDPKTNAFSQTEPAAITDTEGEFLYSVASVALNGWEPAREHLNGLRDGLLEYVEGVFFDVSIEEPTAEHSTYYHYKWKLVPFVDTAVVGGIITNVDDL